MYVKFRLGGQMNDPDNYRENDLPDLPLNCLPVHTVPRGRSDDIKRYMMIKLRLNGNLTNSQYVLWALVVNSTILFNPFILLFIAL